MTATAIHQIFSLLQANNPHPSSELSWSTPFELLVAVILSAQATDVSVNKATKKLFPIANTPSALLDLEEEGLKPYIASIGLYNNKARNIISMCDLLLQRHGGEVPCDREALQALPGVGRKTANVVLNIVFDEPVMAVDTHIFRVSNRTGIASGKTPLAVERGLIANIPDEFLLHAHHWLILHGRYICKARKPQCMVCPILDICNWPDKYSDKVSDKIIASNTK
ncbi:MAG: endonuclease III [Mariprofundales bacterium]